MSRVLRRREFLLAGGSLLGLSVLAACAGPAATPTSVPATAKPAEPTKPAAAEPTKPAAGAPTAAAGAPTAAPAAATPAGPAPTPTSGPINVQGKGTINLLWQFSGGDAWFKASSAALADFVAKTPTVGKVTVQLTPDDWQNKLVAAMVAGTAPDVFDMWGDIMPPFVERNQVVDVQPLANKDYTAADLQDFYPWQWKDFVMPWLNNIRFGMPRYVNIMFTWYRKDLFDKAGVAYPTVDWTHDDYAAAAAKLTVKDSAGKVTQAGLAYPAYAWDRYWYKPVIWGGHTVDPNDNTKCVFDSDQSLAAFEWSRKQMFDLKTMLQPMDLGSQAPTFRLFFNTGRFAMAEDGFYPFEMDDAMGTIPWAYQHTPKGPTGNRKVLGTTDGSAMWKGSKNLDQAWELSKWIAGPVNQTAIVTSSGRCPVRFSVLKTLKDVDVKARPNLSNVNLDVITQAMEMGYPSGREFFKDNNAASEIITPALQAVFVTGSQPTSYMKEIAQKVTTAQRTGTR
jgi:multiple sugar transport system substrate-binding protein